MRAVRTLASQPAECARMGHAGRVAAENVYNRVKIAEDFGISKQEMGEILNQMKIKIGTCQLGCFK
jgi:hypothetical protein